MNNKGQIGELAAYKYLRRRGYKLIDYNFTTRVGEIDLIVTKRDFICFVEVKQRDVSSLGLPREYVDANKQRKIIRSAEIYLAFNETDLQPRFDIVEVYTKDNKIISIKHLENAF